MFLLSGYHLLTTTPKLVDGTNMYNDCRRYDIIIVGGGIAGLAAAQMLQTWGRKVLVLEKSRGVGGRMASRRIGNGVFDHGAQFITARDSRCIKWIQELENCTVAEKWFGGKGFKGGKYPRWRGNPAMTAIAKHIGKGIDVLFNTDAQSLEVKNDLWQVHSTEKLLAATVLLTPPVPQSLKLIDSLSLTLSDEKQSLLKKFNYERCVAVMARLAEPSGISWPGFIRNPSENIAWIADNQTKGISPTPALTLHGSAQFSLGSWDSNRNETAELLIQETKEYLKIDVIDFQVHAWKYSKPLHIYEQRSLEIWPEPQMVLAGDAFGGPRVEGAVLSGWDAAERIESYLRKC